jgi:hypothetical protein
MRSLMSKASDCEDPSRRQARIGGGVQLYAAQLFEESLDPARTPTRADSVRRQLVSVARM